MEKFYMNLILLLLVCFLTSYVAGSNEKLVCDTLCQPKNVTDRCTQTSSTHEKPKELQRADSVFLCCLGYGNFPDYPEMIKYVKQSHTKELTKQEKDVLEILTKIDDIGTALKYAQCFQCFKTDWTIALIQTCLKDIENNKAPCPEQNGCASTKT